MSCIYLANTAVSGSTTHSQGFLLIAEGFQLFVYYLYLFQRNFGLFNFIGGMLFMTVFEGKLSPTRKAFSRNHVIWEEMVLV